MLRFQVYLYLSRLACNLILQSVHSCTKKRWTGTSSSYQTLFQYHTSKQKHKNTTWYWGHDQKAIKAWDNHALTKVSTNIQRLAKIHFTHIQTKIHKNTQDMPQNEINCIQIVKLTSADFRSVWWFYNVLQFCPENSRRRSAISNCTITEHFLYGLLIP